MDFPEDTIAIGAKGKREVRILRTSGADFVVYGYLELDTGKEMGKYSILVRKSDKSLEHWMIVPSSMGKELVVKHVMEEKPKARGIYDRKTNNTKMF